MLAPMPIAEVRFYDVALFFHIMGIILAFGPTYSYGVFFAMAGRDPRALPAVARAVTAWNRLGTTGGIILAIITGLYLTEDLWSFGDFFVIWGMLAVIVLLGLVHGFFIPKTKRLGELAEADVAAAGGGEVTLSPETQDAARSLSTMGPVAGIIVLLTVYFMTAKPFL
jgi:hypothetical protein